MCDHMLGVNISDDGGFLQQSQVSEYSAYAKTRFDDWARNPNAWSKIVEQRKNWTPEQHLFSEYSLFKYCPACGFLNQETPD